MSVHLLLCKCVVQPNLLSTADDFFYSSSFHLHLFRFCAENLEAFDVISFVNIKIGVCFFTRRTFRRFVLLISGRFFIFLNFFWFDLLLVLHEKKMFTERSKKTEEETGRLDVSARSFLFLSFFGL